jgi:hypothetical protein
MLELARSDPATITHKAGLSFCPLQQAVLKDPDSTLFYRFLDLLDPALDLSQFNERFFREYCVRLGFENLIMKEHMLRTRAAPPEDQ